MVDKVVDLGSVSTDILAKTLCERLVAEGTTVVWPLEVFNLVRKIASIPCVDAFPVRWRGLQIPEMGFIYRNTGFYRGKWWCIGGRLNIGESFGHSLTRHVQEALGVGFSLAPGLSWNKPVYVGQYSPSPIPLLEGEYAGHEPSKFCPSNTYLIELESENLTFGSTAHGGQEAKEFRWFPIDALPPEDEIAYGGQATVRACKRWISDNLIIKWEEIGL